MMELPRDDSEPHVLRLFGYPPPPAAVRHNITLGLSIPFRSINREILRINEVYTMTEIVTVTRVYERVKKQVKTDVWRESRRMRKLRAELFPDEDLN